MSWGPLERELDEWTAEGRRATLWWRDDDAVAATPALDRLLRIAVDERIAIALAVIPARAEPSLRRALAGRPELTVLQHGYAHRNHASEGMRAIECGGARSLEDIGSELTQGRQRLSDLFGEQFLPILVPPWNRIDPRLVPRLAALGFRGLSTWGARERREAAAGLVQTHTHADPIAWRKGRVFGGGGRVIGMLVDHLEARRTGRVDPEEPTGLLTHHLAHDAGGWDFLEEGARRLSAHPAVRWVAAAEAFGPAR
jgi:hypothetical protein